LGLALPFLAIGFVPALRNRLPKPGPWMATFRKWMALPMALTALALAVLLWRQVDGGWTDRGAPSTAASGDSFTPTALAKARASGKPVFVYFTADWCLSCKANEGRLQAEGRHHPRRRLDQWRSGHHPHAGRAWPQQRAALPLVCAGRGTGGDLAADPDAGAARRRGGRTVILLHRHCERSEAISSHRPALPIARDCFVAALLAMTGEE
jgi:hypothetical protein